MILPHQTARQQPLHGEPEIETLVVHFLLYAVNGKP